MRKCASNTYVPCFFIGNHLLYGPIFLLASTIGVEGRWTTYSRLPGTRWYDCRELASDKRCPSCILIVQGSVFVWIIIQGHIGPGSCDMLSKPRTYVCMDREELTCDMGRPSSQRDSGEDRLSRFKSPRAVRVFKRGRGYFMKSDSKV